MKLKRRGRLPGFGLSLGITVSYLGVLVILPLSLLVWRSLSLSPSELWATVTSPRARAAYALSFSASAIAATVNLIFGTIVAWVLARYRFPGRWLADALVDLPFALPTAVAGIALTSLCADGGLIGRHLAAHGIHAAFTSLGVTIALVFVGLPFVVRSVEPVLHELDPQLEEAAATLGASRFTTFCRVILPALGPSLLAGFALAFARALGEYGSVAFISGNMPLKTEIIPLLIIIKLEQFDYAGATAIAAVMLGASFLLLFTLNSLSARLTRREAQ